MLIRVRLPPLSAATKGDRLFLFPPLPSLFCANDSMSGPNLLDSSQESVLDLQLVLDQVGVIRNTTPDEKHEDFDFEEGGLRGWLAVLGAQVSTHVSSIIISA